MQDFFLSLWQTNAIAMKKIIFIIIISISFWQCKQAKMPENYGKIEPEIALSNDSTQTYALYVPKSYFTNKNAGLVIAFDPEANGKKPVALLQEIAEEFNFIIAGSNVSRNGENIVKIRKHVHALLDELMHKYPVNEGRIYTLGFSGGAKVAGTIAGENQEVSATIACSGLPNDIYLFLKKKNFLLITLVGNEDFNYADAYHIEQQRNQTPLKHEMIPFNGGHQWPNNNALHEAFTLLTLHEKKSGKMPADSTKIIALIDSTRKRAAKLSAQGQYLMAYDAYVRLYRYSYAIIIDDVSRQLQKEMLQIYDNKDFQLQLSNVPINFEKEVAEREKISKIFKNLMDKAPKKIKPETEAILKYFNEIKQNPSLPDTMLQKRLQAYMGILCYAVYQQHPQQQALNTSDDFLQMWKSVDYKQPQPCILLAEKAAKENKIDNAIALLQEAANRKYKDLEHLKKTEALNTLQQHQQWPDILEKVKQNAAN